MNALERYLSAKPPRANPQNPAPGEPRAGDVHRFAMPSGAAAEGTLLKADAARASLLVGEVLWPRVPRSSLGARVGGGAVPLLEGGGLTFARRWLGWPYGHYAAAIAEGSRSTARTLPTGAGLWAELTWLESQGVDPLHWGDVRVALRGRVGLPASPTPERHAQAAALARRLLALGPPPVLFDTPLRRPPWPAPWEWTYRAGGVTVREAVDRRPPGAEPEDLAGVAARGWLASAARRSGVDQRNPHLGQALAAAVPAPEPLEGPGGWWTVGGQ